MIQKFYKILITIGVNEMMAQEMYEENKVLQDEIDSLKVLINDIDDFLRECDVQTAEEDREIGKLQERIRSIQRSLLITIGVNNGSKTI